MNIQFNDNVSNSYLMPGINGDQISEKMKYNMMMNDAATSLSYEIQD